MSDLIKRSDAIKALRKLGHEVVVVDKVCSLGVATEFIDVIRTVPSADRPSGEWIDAGTDLDGTHYYRCSHCGWEVDTDYPNCPYCTAKMKGADDGNN